MPKITPSELIDRLGGGAAVAHRLNEANRLTRPYRPDRVRMWKSRDAIPFGAWIHVAMAFPEITVSLLAEMHVNLPRRPE